MLLNIALALLLVLAAAATSVMAIKAILRRVAGGANVSRAKQFHQTHDTPVPRFGGLAFVIPLAVLYICVLAFPSASFPLQREDHAIILTSLAMFCLGFWDDCRNLGAKVKLAGQLLIAAGAWYWGDVRIETFKNPTGWDVLSIGVWSAPLTIFWIVSLTNLMNIIDGIDGLAGGIGLMLMTLLAYLGIQDGSSPAVLITLATIGGILGFLRFNFPPATIYMGDGGAYFLGCIISLLALRLSHKGTVFGALIAPLLALGLPIADTSLAIIRRALKGLPIFRSDKGHIHHRLINAGFGKAKAVVFLYGLSTVFLISALTILASHGRAVGVVFGCACIIFILSIRSFSLNSDWMNPMSAFGQRIALRKETKYALTLCLWIELEAERGPSLPVLWRDFCFMCEKMGFCKVTLRFHEGPGLVHNSSSPVPSDSSESFGVTHKLSLAGIREIEIRAPSSGMKQKTLEHFSDLASEAWLNAISKWSSKRTQISSFTAKDFTEPGSITPGRA